MSRGIQILAMASALLVMFPITACMTGNAQPSSAVATNNKLIGVWEDKDYQSGAGWRYVFFADGTCSSGYIKGTSGKTSYSVYENVLLIDNSLYTFTISGGNLELYYYGSSDSHITFKKVK